MNKEIDRRIKYFLVVDIETANDLEDNIAYDIGFAVTDRRGKIYESGSYMVAEMFYDYADLMQSAYYAEKLPTYWKELAEGKRKIKGLLTIRRIINHLMEQYEITDVWAYNCRFDRRGLDNTMRYVTKSNYRWFFPYGTEFHCIQHCACQTLLQQKAYFRFAIENGLLTPNGNLSTTAENAYRYISKDTDFEENHTGREDVEIEIKILVKCFNQHKAMDTAIAPNAWQLPQKSFKEFVKRLDKRLKV